MPISQFAMRFQGHIGVHDYEGVALDEDERSRLIRDIGTHNVLMLRNHGVLTVGRSVAEAFILMYYFEKAARVQTAALSAAAGGAKLVTLEPRISGKASHQFNDHHGDIRAAGSREWPAFLRLLDRIDPSYRE